MKRVLLASALATMALAANAQALEVLRSSKGFNVISKNLTTSGKNILYSSSGDSKDGTYTIYDDNFLQTKTFSFTGKEFSCKTVGKKALATITKKTLESIDYDDVYRDESKNINTMEEFVNWMNAERSDNVDDPDRFSIKDCFTDYEGNFACHEPGDSLWQEPLSITDIDGKPAVIIREESYYYNKEDKKIHERSAVFTTEFDVASLNWEIDDSYSGDNAYTDTYHEEVECVEVKDFDNLQCNRGGEPYISQTLFNNDDKYEYVVKSYREGTEPSDKNTNFNNGLKLGYKKMQDGKFVIKKTVQDHYYNTYLYVADEDGNKLFDLPGNYGYYFRQDDFKIYRLNGKTLFEAQDYDSTSRETSYSLYLYDSSTNGIQELARTQASSAKQLFNLQGMQVDGNAKGIVIQRGGRKYINR